jgi:hypothetical protein
MSVVLALIALIGVGFVFFLAYAVFGLSICDTGKLRCVEPADVGSEEP